MTQKNRPAALRDYLTLLKRFNDIFCKIFSWSLIVGFGVFTACVDNNQNIEKHHLYHIKISRLMSFVVLFNSPLHCFTQTQYTSTQSSFIWASVNPASPDVTFSHITNMCIGLVCVCVCVLLLSLLLSLFGVWGSSMWFNSVTFHRVFICPVGSLRSINVNP